MNISHLLYKVDDLDDSVNRFRDMGFKVEYGKKKDPYNALIYFSDHSYIELIENMHITSFLKFMLKLFRMDDYLESSLEQEKLNEGFFRIAFHMKKDEMELLKERYKEILKCKTILVPVSRKDIHGYILKSKCLLPSNARYPFFNTDLKGGNVWNEQHPNNINGIEKIVYSAQKEELKFMRNIPIDSRVEVIDGGRGIDYIEFKYNKLPKLALRYCDGEWK